MHCIARTATKKTKKKLKTKSFFRKNLVAAGNSGNVAISTLLCAPIAGAFGFTSEP
jgi:H+/Cl- antiporter ClcA